MTGGRLDLWIPGASMRVVTVTARACRGCDERPDRACGWLQHTGVRETCTTTEVKLLHVRGRATRRQGKRPRTSLQFIVFQRDEDEHAKHGGSSTKCARYAIPLLGLPHSEPFASNSDETTLVKEKPNVSATTALLLAF
jgi:hypothetical protein